jgi:hypothetical protein
MSLSYWPIEWDELRRQVDSFQRSTVEFTIKGEAFRGELDELVFDEKNVTLDMRWFGKALSETETEVVTSPGQGAGIELPTNEFQPVRWENGNITIEHKNDPFTFFEIVTKVRAQSSPSEIS